MNAENNESTHKVPKKKIPGKKVRLADHKKPIIAGGIITVIAIASIIGGIVLLGEIDEPRGDTLVIGVTGTLTTIDPLEGWWSTFNWMIPQIVTEGLFALEFKNNSSHLIPNLATGYNWSVNKTELTCSLRENVEFHDGTPFNATAVKWNIDRLHLLLDTVGSDYAYIWQLPDGDWIINETKVLDEYTVKFVLNQPFVPLLSVLTTPSSLIASPSSTPANEYINGTIPGTLSGTGAFIYSAYEEENYATLLFNPDYWGGRPAFDDVIIKFYPNDTVRYEAMLSGELSMTFWSDRDEDLLINTTGIELEKYLFPGMTFIYINNNLINATMRKAISYAFNYSAYANLDLMVKQISPIRIESPIIKGMPYSHWGSFDMPYYNISIARQALKDANWPGTEELTANSNITAGNEWEMVANSLTPFATYNYTFPTGTSEDHLYYLLNENLKQIGVKFNQTPELSFPELFFICNDFTFMGYHKNMLGLSRYWWQVDYYDPASMINPMFSNKVDGIWNAGQVNDSQVQDWMEEALEEINETVRDQRYFQIEERLIEEVFPVVWLDSYVSIQVHVSNLHWTPDLGIFTIKDWYFD